MNFLRRHYEKLILGTALVALLISVALLLHSLGKTRTQVNDMAEKARLAAKGGSDVDLLQQDPIVDVYQALSDPAVRFETVPADKEGRLQRGSLYEPRDYVVCYSDTCNRIIPIDADVCPFCGEEQPPRQDEAENPENDRDGDGIPNFIERSTAFLNPDNPYDARADYDRDTFLNIEEFNLNTAMDDPTSRPPLGYNLRFAGVVRRTLPIRLKGISANSDDPEDWRITMEFYDPSRSRWRTRLSALGKAVEGYTIRSARMIDNPQKEGEQIGVVEVNPPGGEEPYTLRAGETARQREEYARMYFLRSRHYRNATRGGVVTITRKQGEEFTLPLQIGGRGGRVETETYRVEEVTPASVTVVRTQPPPDAGEAPVQLTPPQLNRRTDFIPRNAGRTTTGGMPGEDPTMRNERGRTRMP